MRDMFKDVTLSIENYEALLMGWGDPEQSIQNNVYFNGGNSKYCDGSPTFSARIAPSTLTARERLINEFRWRITDGGGIECN